MKLQVIHGLKNLKLHVEAEMQFEYPARVKSRNKLCNTTPTSITLQPTLEASQHTQLKLKWARDSRAFNKMGRLAVTRHIAVRDALSKNSPAVRFQLVKVGFRTALRFNTTGAYGIILRQNICCNETC